MFLQQHLGCKSLQKAFSRVVGLSDDIKFALLHPESIEVMPNGKRGRSGDSVDHTSDSESRVVLKQYRRWKRSAYQKKVRAAARRIQYFFATRAPELDMQIIYRIAEFVGAR